MPRFRYPFAAALDDAVACENRSGRRVSEAQAIVTDHEHALAQLAALARAGRSELLAGVALPGGLYVEVGRRLKAFDATDRERRARLAVASRDLEGARRDLAEQRTRRLALERHRDMLHARHLCAVEARAAAEFDEANIVRPARVAWNSP